MEVFSPLSSQPSAVFCAVIRSAAASDPDPGSVRPSATIFSPATNGRYPLLLHAVAAVSAEDRGDDQRGERIGHVEVGVGQLLHRDSRRLEIGMPVRPNVSRPAARARRVRPPDDGSSRGTRRPGPGPDSPAPTPGGRTAGSSRGTRHARGQVESPSVLLSVRSRRSAPNPWSPRSPSTVDGQRLTGNETGLRGRQKCHRNGQLVRFTPASHRRSAGCPSLPILPVPELLGHLGAEHPGGTAFTVMPLLATSTARHWVSAITAAFDMA